MVDCLSRPIATLDVAEGTGEGAAILVCALGLTADVPLMRVNRDVKTTTSL